MFTDLHREAGQKYSVQLSASFALTLKQLPWCHSSHYHTVSWTIHCPLLDRNRICPSHQSPEFQGHQQLPPSVSFSPKWVSLDFSIFSSCHDLWWLSFFLAGRCKHMMLFWLGLLLAISMDILIFYFCLCDSSYSKYTLNLLVYTPPGLCGQWVSFHIGLT